MSAHSWIRGAALAGLLAALGGCVVAPIGPYPGDGYPAGDVVPVAPPPPQAEHYGPPPVAGYIWLGGFWRWVGHRHVWVAGHWAPPRPGYYWAPHRWAPVAGGWRYAPGHWARR
jgi:hypothetical protein